MLLLSLWLHVDGKWVRVKRAAGMYSPLGALGASDMGMPRVDTPVR